MASPAVVSSAHFVWITAQRPLLQQKHGEDWVAQSRNDWTRAW